MEHHNRRRALGLIGGATLIPMLGCAKKNGGTGDCSSVPEETGGPYPGDGSNGPNVLAMGGIVRSDIRSSFAGMSGSADGVPLTIRIQLVGVDLSCAALAGYAIYVWHCDRVGGYSLYTAAEQNYLRGVQATDADGIAAFNSIFPGAYSGRWPHVHFEIYPDVASATSSSRKLITSQLALPEAVCNDVYATSGYEQSMNNLAQSSLDSDSVFRDGYDQQLAAVTGNVTDGYVANLTVAIAA